MGTVPYSLNQTERRAWNWLTDNQPYSPDEIDREDSQQVPDFKTPDGGYEAKLLYRPKEEPAKIMLSRRQVELLDEHNPTVLVFESDSDTPTHQFRWEGGNEAPVGVDGRWKDSTTTRPPEISDKAMAKVEVLRSVLADEIGVKPPLDKTIEAVFTVGIDDGRISPDAHERVREELNVPNSPFS